MLRSDWSARWKADLLGMTVVSWNNMLMKVQKFSGEMIKGLGCWRAGLAQTESCEAVATSDDSSDNVAVVVLVAPTSTVLNGWPCQQNAETLKGSCVNVAQTQWRFLEVLCYHV